MSLQQGVGRDTGFCLVREEEQPHVVALNLIGSASVMSVTGGLSADR